MEAFRKSRTVLRTSLSKAINGFKAETEKDEINMDALKVAFALIEEKNKNLETVNEQIFKLLIEENTSEEDMLREIDSADDYKIKFNTAKVIIQRLLTPPQTTVDDSSRQNSRTRVSTQSSNNIKKFKYPKLELRKFSGELIDWLPFWSVFKKIHEDQDVSNEEKYQYLMQSMTENTRASELVYSYPPTAENYKKVIESLKNRFGREDLLVEVYVRELLRLVLNKAKDSLTSIYDKLETRLRALESLGVTTAMCAAMLFPLVESSLPEEILRAWQRQNAGSKDAKDRLEKLMIFLEAEVQNEERISMAIQGFEQCKITETTNGKSQKKNKAPPVDKTVIPTAAGLLAVKDTNVKPAICIFCEEKHESSKCEKAKLMSLEERLNIAKQKRACFKCLKLYHSAQLCKSRERCAWCGYKHTLLMCRNVLKGESTSKESEPKNTKVEDLTMSCKNITTGTQVFLQTLRVKVKGPFGECKVRALIDCGSHHSYILSDIAERMKLEVIGEKTMIHSLFGGAQTKPQGHNEFKLILATLKNDYNCVLTAYSQNVICSKLPTISSNDCIDHIKKLNIKFEDLFDDQEPISVLIGADFAGRLYTGNIHQLPTGPTAIETKLGWTLMGKNKTESIRVDAAQCVLAMFNEEANISDLWNLEVLGITDPVATIKKEEKLRKIKENFKSSIIINEENRYEVTLPWKEDHDQIKGNRLAAEKRLEKVTQKLKAENLYDGYEKVFYEWLDEGIIEIVERDSEDNQDYYLPHRHVIKENSTTRIRPVFDSSAKSKNAPSLKQCLETGPNYIELIPDVLTRFRENEFGIIADIKKAFLQICIATKDRNMLKFLWWSKADPKELLVFRHKRVVFGLNCSSFLLGATIEYHLEKEMSLTSSARIKYLLLKLLRGFYVDNCVVSVSSQAEIIEFKNLAIAVMKKAGFDLRGWEHTGTNESCEKSPILGIIWNKKEDTLSLSCEFKDYSEKLITKRGILSITHKVFDPLGWACPVLLQPKSILQELWKNKLAWDDEVPEEESRQFKIWASQLGIIREFSVTRWIFGNEKQGDKISLHMFVDASKYAYAAALFVRVERADNVTVYLVQSKSRVAPKEKPTIPRMELLAALIGSRLMTSFKKSTNICTEDITYWSDSSTVLWWLRKHSRWSKFVQNRVLEIREMTKVDLWRHVPGKINPADLPSRGCSAAQLVQSKWWEGPGWLRNPKDQWPEENCEVDQSLVHAELAKCCREKIEEGSKVYDQVLSCTCTTMIKNSEVPWYLERISKYKKLLRVYSWVFRFIKNIQSKKESRIKDEISVSELQNTEKFLIKLAQRESFEGPSDLRLKGLNVYVDETGIIRSKTIISNREDSKSFLFPIVMDSNHKLTKRIIESTHLDLKHAGISTTMQVLREKMWITSCRRAVRSVISRCWACKRHSSKRLESPPTSLPANRVRDAAVFEITGLDYAGPLYLKENKKAWVCLFTCAVYRVTHLELVTTLSTNGFLEALRRFIARRGRPRVVYSDNGTNFTGANQKLRLFDWKKFKDTCTTERIEWIFNPPSAPWWGGWWERIIRILKDLLKRTLKSASLSYEEMITLLCECEAVINARPIAPNSDENNSFLAITPEMFIKEIRAEGMPDLDNLDKTSRNRRLQYIQRLRDEIKMRFRSEYLGQLARRNKVPTKTGSVKAGDIVLIADDSKKRLNWPLARVLQAIPGKDGVVRVVRLKTTTGEITRPLQRIILLEESVIKHNASNASPKTREEKEIRRDDFEESEIECNERNPSPKTREEKEIRRNGFEEIMPDGDNQIKKCTRSGRKY